MLSLYLAILSYNVFVIIAVAIAKIIITITNNTELTFIDYIYMASLLSIISSKLSTVCCHIDTVMFVVA